MVRAFLACLLALFLLPNSGDAVERKTLGWGRLFTNDFLGEGRDRWRTGSYWVSLVRGPGWNGALPDQFGEIIEYRFRSEIITPANLTGPDPSDRRFVGALSFGAHTHFHWNGLETSVGADLVFTGPQTGLGEFQQSLHEFVGAPVTTILGDQIPNGIHPTALVELGKPVALAHNLRLRPFIEMQAGVESRLRIGADLHCGKAGLVDMSARDLVTGHRVPVTQSGPLGLTFTFGGDVAYVENSVYLPSSDGYDISEPRWRARAGVVWQWSDAQVFYGLTYLGEEFGAQNEGQVLGSLMGKVSF